MMAMNAGTLSAVLLSWARERPEALALCDGNTTFTYAALAEEVDAAAGRFAGLGVEQGDRVIVIGNNIWQWVIGYLGILRFGAVAVPLNNRISPIQARDFAAVLDARLALTDSEHAPLFDECHNLHVSGLGVSIGDGNFWDVEAADPPVNLPSLDQDAVISFSSGTTGSPKGAVLTQNAIATGSRVFANELELSSDDSTLVLAPLFHNTGFVDQLGQMILCGGRTDLLCRYRTERALEALKHRPVTFLTAVPSVLRLLMTSAGAEHAFGSAHCVLYGGSPMPAAWSDELFRRWPHLKLWHGYGLTEFTSCCTLLPPKWIKADGESIGFPPPEVKLRLVNGEGDDVDTGETGEIWVAGPTRMKQYWRQPELTAQKLSGEWLRTGDLAYRDDRGLLFHAGRVDDVINRAGEKILPSFLESVLSERPDVAQCVVFGVPHPVLQNEVYAAVEVRSSHVFDEQAAIDLLRQRVPGYAVPHAIFDFGELPRTASGKVDRRATRQAYLAKQELAVDCNQEIAG